MILGGPALDLVSWLSCCTLASGEQLLVEKDTRRNTDITAQECDDISAMLGDGGDERLRATRTRNFPSAPAALRGVLTGAAVHVVMC